AISRCWVSTGSDPPKRNGRRRGSRAGAGAALGTVALILELTGRFSFHRAGGPEPVEMRSFQGYQVGNLDNLLVFHPVYRPEFFLNPFSHFRREMKPAGDGVYLKNPPEKFPVFPGQPRHQPWQGGNGPFSRQKNPLSSNPSSY